MSSIKVKAIEMGFRDGRRIHVGEVFRVPLVLVKNEKGEEVPKMSKWYVPYVEPKEKEIPEPKVKAERAVPVFGDLGRHVKTAAPQPEAEAKSEGVDDLV